MAGVEGAENESQVAGRSALKTADEIKAKLIESKPANEAEPLTNGHTNGNGTHTEAEHPLANGDGAAPQVNGQEEDADAETKPNGQAEAEEEEGATTGETKEGATTADQDVVLIQDTGFNIKIQAPGMDPFDLPVSSMELVQEIYQVLIDREDTCHRTCFSLQLDGTTLDNFAELKSIEGLQEGSLIKVVEEPYTARQARIHVRHIRDLLKSVDSEDAYNGIDCNSLSFLTTITAGDVMDRKNKQDSIDCTPPEYVMPCSNERPLLPLHPTNKEQKAGACLKVLTFSGWNPPPGNRKMHGDLLYLYVKTLEEKRFHITASTRGFYLNQSTQDEFDPRAAPQKYLNHSLIDLLGQISPAFKRNLQILLKKRSQKHPFERVPTPYQVYAWMAPAMEHHVDSIRAEDAFSSRLGYEEHIPGQTRDWNEELQTTRELPRKNLPERLIRERAIFKVHSDFVVAATRGAMAVIDGNIMAINPGEEAKMQMFLWNNIFFSLGFDVKDHYKDFGGDFAAYAAPGCDLQGVKAYAAVDPEGLYTLGTVVVDYRGYRVTAQSIIPGILEREQEQSVVYGSVDFGKTVISNEKYLELLQKTSTALKIRPHKVLNDKEEEVELYSSVECKGIVGNDGRHYVLDLLRTFPPDVNFMKVDGVELSEVSKAQGFPVNHCHKLVCLRQELVDAFIETRYLAFVKHAAYQFQQLRLQKQLAEKEKADKEKESESEEKEKAEGTKDVEKKEEIETNEAKKIVEALTGTDASTLEENSKDIVKKAAQAVGSLSDTEFVAAFNTDVYQLHVRHANPESDVLKKEQQLVKDAAEFLLVHQIPAFVRDCLEHTSSPIDGYTLTESMHHHGINMRYLGKVTEEIAKLPQLSYLYNIAICELICRAAKHLFKLYMQGVEMMSLSSAISHFLNCFLGSFPSPHTQAPAQELTNKRKKNKKKNKVLMLQSLDNTEWVSETPKTLWKKLLTEIKSYYQFKLESETLDTLTEELGIHKVVFLRSISRKIGVTIMLRDYSLDNKNKQTFFEEDIVNIFPVVKHIHPKATDAYTFFTSGQNKIQQGLLRDGYELISEALNLLNNVYGAMHPEIAACCRLLARLNYIMGDYPEALSFQQRAVLMSERVMGIDHPNTITEYAHLALYCFANSQVTNALKLMYRSRYLAVLCSGEDHPEVALFDSNIGLILHAVGEYELSLRFLDKALELNKKYFGVQSLKVAMSYHLVARAQSCKGDFRKALKFEKEAFTIYKAQLGEAHERTKESSECLKHLTQQAVVFQKKMNELYKGEKDVSFPPIQIQTPTLANVLDTLNVINGIVFVHISPEDIEKFRLEMMRRQQGGATSSISDAKQEIEDQKTAKDSSEEAAEKESTESPATENKDAADAVAKQPAAEQKIKDEEAGR